MVELGKQMGKLEAISGSLERLENRLGKLDDKVDALEHKVTFVKGAIWVIGPILILLVALLGWYFSGKLAVTINPAG